MSALFNLHDYEQAARERLSQMAYEYYAGGAEDEMTLRENRAIYERFKLAPRMLRAVAERDASTTLLGQPLKAPLLIAPMAFMKMAHPEGELAVARAAAARGLGMIVSTMATYAFDEITAAAPGGLRWFQLYAFKDRGLTRALVENAEAAGHKAVALTVDMPVLGRREADLRNQFGLPEGVIIKNIANLLSADQQSKAGGVLAYRSSERNDNLSWEDIDWLRSITRMPVLVKGILRADDARLAVEHGVAGVIVSNHGGRQLDGAVSTLEALPAIADAVGDQVALLVDGGIRRGTDWLKAMALGAHAVLLGRPALWGLAVNGEAGVGHVLDLLLAEFDMALALCGCHDVSEITRDLIFGMT